MLNPTGGNIMDEVALTGGSRQIGRSGSRSRCSLKNRGFAPEQQGL